MCLELPFVSFISFTESLLIFFDHFLYQSHTHAILFNSDHYISLIQNSSLIFSFKLLSTILFLVLIRGGTPRYRYDYLTKLGWLKILGLVVAFLSVFICFYFFF